MTTQQTVDDIMASLAHVLRQMERDARNWEAQSHDWELRWRAVTKERDVLQEERREAMALLSADPRTAAGDTLVAAITRVSASVQQEETRLSIAERMARYLGWAFEQKLIRPLETTELLAQVLHEWKEASND